MTHHSECEDATGEYPGSCTCAIIKRREAMDNLIAQDADLIDTNDKDSAVLLPCPFCGGVQIEAFHHIDRGWGASWHVECVAEECGNSTCHHDTEATAIAAWNKRQPTQSDALHMDAADRIEQLEREKAVVSDLWEQQKEIALDYLTDCNKAAERIEAQSAEIEWLRVEVKAQYDRGYYDGCTRAALKARGLEMRSKNDD